MHPPQLILVSHHLCPYVQRAAIALAEKGAAFERHAIDLADKPDWFRAISPLGKVPLLRVRLHEDGPERVLFESAAILEYLDDTLLPRLHPADPLVRAEHRAWIEFGSAVLGDVAGLYASPDATAFEARRCAVADKFVRIEARLSATGPWFDGAAFSLVDAAFGPVFRYFDAFDCDLGDLDVLNGRSTTARWRAALCERLSVRSAVGPDYPERLRAFLAARGSHLSRLMEARVVTAA